jgi:hypothetical protein
MIYQEKFSGVRANGQKGRFRTSHKLKRLPDNKYIVRSKHDVSWLGFKIGR